MTSTVPILLRSACLKASRFAPVKTMGEFVYEQVAERFASQMIGVRGVSEVRWRGGAIDHCVPGVSDLDFTVILDEMDESSEIGACSEITAKYQRLKRVAPMLGELLMTTRERLPKFHDTAPSLHHCRFRPWRGRQFGPVSEDPTPRRILPQSEFALSLGHYARAIHFWLLSATQGHEEFHLTQSSKEAKKAGHSDLAQLYFTLHRKACAVSTTEAMVPLRAMPCAEPDPNLMASDFVLDCVKRQSADLLIESTPIAYVWVANFDDPASAQTAFNELRSLPRRERNFRFGGTPIFLSAEMWALYCRGWGPGPIASKLAHTRLRSSISKRSLEEKTVLASILLPGMFITDPVGALSLAAETGLKLQHLRPGEPHIQLPTDLPTMLRFVRHLTA